MLNNFAFFLKSIQSSNEYDQSCWKFFGIKFDPFCMLKTGFRRNYLNTNLWKSLRVQSRNSGGQPQTFNGVMSRYLRSVLWCAKLLVFKISVAWLWVNLPRRFGYLETGCLGWFKGQQSPQRSDVFWEGLFRVLNPRPPMGADGHWTSLFCSWTYPTLPWNLPPRLSLRW